MLHILLVTSQVIEDTGTTYRCTSNLFDILKRFTYLGDIFICSGKFNGHNSHTKIEKDLAGIIKYGNITFLKKDYIYMSSANKALIDPLAKNSDLLISYGSSYDLLKIARNHNKKFMSFVVSCAWDAYWNHGWRGKIIAPFKFIRSRYTIKHSDYVLYVSDQFLQERYPTNAKYKVGCSNVKIVTMDDATLIKRIEFLANDNGDVLNIATTAAVDVFYKGQQYVLRAMYEMKKKGKINIHYYLLGGGNNKRLCSLTKKYGLQKQVHFMGIVPHAKVFDVLDKMHVYIQPSLQEGLPRSMVEAMSRGLLCIGANTAAIPELIQPKYVTRRKSHKDIIKLIENMSKEELIEQAKFNFEKAKIYQEEVINARRNKFFDHIINDIIN